MRRRPGAAPQSGHGPSMKVPPKRKGNRLRPLLRENVVALNESPSEKEGKSERLLSPLQL